MQFTKTQIVGISSLINLTLAGSESNEVVFGWIIFYYKHKEVKDYFFTKS